MYLQFPILGGALLGGARLSDIGLALPAILTSDLHLAGLALLLLLPTASTALRTSLLLAGLWLLPALSAGDARLARACALLDAGAPLRSSDRSLAAALAAGVALSTCAYLLRTSTGRTPPG
jgi:hypothetical protein